MSGEPKAQETEVEAPQCQFFVQRKKRLCRMTVKPGRRFCGEHEPQPKNDAGENDRRIPCPNDPKHTCYASKLEKHLKICNARRTEQPAYIVENINAPQTEDSVPRRPLSAVPKDALKSLIDKVNHLYAKHLADHITAEPEQPIHRAVLAEFSAPDRAESSRRHLRQASALLALVERAGLVRDGACYVELGAGKGQLSYYACHAWCARGGRVLAVDRAPLRHKRDNKLRSAPPRPAKRPRETDPNGHGRRDSIACAVNVSRARRDVNPSGIGGGDNIACAVNVAHDSQREVSFKANSSSDNIEDSMIKTPHAHEESNTQHGHEEMDTENSQADTDRTLTQPQIDSVKSSESDKNHISAEPTDNTTDSNNISSNGASTASNKKDSDTTDKSVTTSDGNEVGDSEVASRLRADLAHLVLEAVPAVQASTGVVGIAKHLCGVATDYALRCLARGARGAVLAACCHHRCARAGYVAAAQLQELGIDAEEFNIMLGIVSWATCGDGRSRSRRASSPLLPPPEEGPPQEGGQSREEREEIGRKAKALLDWGRVLWLRERGFEARLCYYVPKSVSLENMCIVAKRR